MAPSPSFPDLVWCKSQRSHPFPFSPRYPITQWLARSPAVHSLTDLVLVPYPRSCDFFMPRCYLVMKAMQILVAFERFCCVDLALVILIKGTTPPRVSWVQISRLSSSKHGRQNKDIVFALKPVYR